MDRELKSIHLSDKTEVKIITYLTWGEKERIVGSATQNVELTANGTSKINGNMMFEYKKYSAKECIKQIVKGDQEIPFSYTWVENLSVQDGDLLWSEINDLIDGKKKVN